MAPQSFTQLIALYDSKADEHESKAREYRTMAANLRRDLKAFGISDKGIASAPRSFTPRPPFTREGVHKYLETHNARAQQISAVFAVPLEQVDAFISDPANGLTDKDRGWIKVVSEDAAANTEPVGEKPV